MFGIKLPKKQDLKRYSTLLAVLTKYGFEDVMANSPATKIIPKSYLFIHPEAKTVANW